MTANVADLAFLPRPWRLAPGPGRFSLDAATRLQVAAGASEATVAAARNLQAALAEQTGLALHLVPTGSPVAERAISLVLVGRDDAVFPADRFGWESPAEEGEQAYTLRVGDAGAVVAATGEAGLFYGVQTLIQLAKGSGRLWPGAAIADRPVLPHRGLMLDVSRAKVPTLETLQHLARTLAHYKYNQLQLHTEHTFRFPSHPEIGADAGSLTADDMLALDAVCREHHVALVPNLQSLGHQRALLSLPRYEGLAETPWKWSFATANEGSFALLDDLFGDLLPAFSSRLFNVNADEPWDMGRGRSKALADEIGLGRLFLRHIERVRELAANHGRQVMIWADVFWHEPGLVGELPDDVILLDWWYEPKERYETVDVIAAAGRRFYVCPGTSGWSALFPRLENAIANVRGFVRAGVAAGAEGMLMTDWGDFGHYQLYSHSWYPYLWAADSAWTGAATDSDAFDDAFGRLFLEDAAGTQVAALRRLGAAVQPPVGERWVDGWHTAMALFEDPLTGRVAAASPPEVVAEAAAAAEAVFPLLGQVRAPLLRHDLGFTAAQIRFACAKVESTREARALLTELAAHDRPTVAGRQRLDALIATLTKQRDELPPMVEEFEARWLAQARPSEIGINLARFAALIARYDAAIAWLGEQRAAYLAGRPVDAALTSYDIGDYAVLHDESRRKVEELVELVGIDAVPPDLRRWYRLETTPPETPGAA